MQLTIMIERLPNRDGYSARCAAPIDLSAEGATADEAEQRLSALLQEKLRQGVEFRTLTIGSANGRAPGGWLPDDDLTKEWLQHIQDYRAECDARDQQELEELERLESGEA